MSASYPGARTPELDEPYPGAPWGEAFTRFWKKGFTFSGRATRSEYWKAALLAVILPLVVMSVLVQLVGGADSGGGTVLGIAFGLWFLAMIIPSISVTVRRLHDANFSGAAYFVTFIPFVGSFILFIFTVLDSNPLGARFDPRPAGAVPVYGGIPSAPEPFGGAPRAYGAAPPGSTGVPGGSAVPAPPPAFSVPPAAFGAPPSPVPSMPPAPTAFAAPPAEPASSPVAEVSVAAVPSSLGAPLAPPPPRSATASSPAGWILQLPGGRRMDLAGGVVFGRDPAPSASGDTAVSVGGDEKSVSKTHGRMYVRDGVAYASDLHSTNGTEVVVASGAVETVSPGADRPLAAGDRVRFGDYEVRLLAGASR